MRDQLPTNTHYHHLQFRGGNASLGSLFHAGMDLWAAFTQMIARHILGGLVDAT
jgi:hypothetical protein